MYYEIHGEGFPIVLIHGGGSTIQTTFGRLIPFLSKTHKIIAMDLQAHGRTGDRDAWLSFEQDADDVVKLLENLDISKADIMGFSNGGQTAIALALKHPQRVNKLILCSTFYSRDGCAPQFWEIFEDAKFSEMPQVYKDEFLKLTRDEKALLNMFNKDVQRMKNFKGWTEEEMHNLQNPTLVINADNDVGTPEHAVLMYRVIPNCKLAIFPGAHGTYLGEIATSDGSNELIVVPLIEEFLSGTD